MSLGLICVVSFHIYLISYHIQKLQSKILIYIIGIIDSAKLKTRKKTLKKRNKKIQLDS